MASVTRGLLRCTLPTWALAALLAMVSDDRIGGDGRDDRPAGTDLDTAPDGDVLVRDPAAIRDPLPQPLLSWRRVAIVAVLAVAAGCLVIAARSGGDTAREGVDSAVVRYLPQPGGRVLRQSEVGVELEPGYDGRLTVNGVAIPEEQMSGAIVEGSEAWDRLTEEQRRLGPRPNNKQRVFFSPGEGKAVSEFDTGEVRVDVELWKVADGRESARTLSYTVFVT